MTWKELLAEKRVDVQPTSKAEIDELWQVADRNLQDASLPGLSIDGQFNLHYSAARTLATIAIRAKGYRIKPVGGGHYNTFLAMEAAMGRDYLELAAYFDRCRQKRNDLCYDAANVVTATEAGELADQVNCFYTDMKKWLAQHHSELV